MQAQQTLKSYWDRLTGKFSRDRSAFIFHSPEFRAHFERPARLNLERELAILIELKN